MKSNIKIVFILLSLGVLSGCGAGAYMQPGYPSAVTPAIIYSDDVVYPYKDSFTMFNISREDYSILGHVTTEMESMNILFIYSSGDNGYGKLLAAAKEKYPETNALMNVYWDSKVKTIGWPYPPIPFYQKITARVTATAVSIR